MPQASDELRAKFEDDSAAWKVLENNYIDDRGIITPKINDYKPTKEEGDAIDYLCDEWDYSYNPNSLLL